MRITSDNFDAVRSDLDSFKSSIDSVVSDPLSDINKALDDWFVVNNLESLLIDYDRSLNNSFSKKLISADEFRLARSSVSDLLSSIGDVKSNYYSSIDVSLARALRTLKRSNLTEKGLLSVKDRLSASRFLAEGIGYKDVLRKFDDALLLCDSKLLSYQDSLLDEASRRDYFDKLLNAYSSVFSFSLGRRKIKKIIKNLSLARSLAESFSDSSLLSRIDDLSEKYENLLIDKKEEIKDFYKSFISKSFVSLFVLSSLAVSSVALYFGVNKWFDSRIADKKRVLSSYSDSLSSLEQRVSSLKGLSDAYSDSVRSKVLNYLKLVSLNRSLYDSVAHKKSVLSSVGSSLSSSQNSSSSSSSSNTRQLVSKNKASNSGSSNNDKQNNHGKGHDYVFMTSAGSFPRSYLVGLLNHLSPLLDRFPYRKIIYVDKRDNLTFLLEKSSGVPGSFVLLNAYRHTDAVDPRRKTRIGEKRTPEGVYSVDGSVLLPYVDELFGRGFLRVGYPNRYERLNGFSGKGVLLCGSSSKAVERAIDDGLDVMNVGVALKNRDFVDLYNRVKSDLDNTLIVIEDPSRSIVSEYSSLPVSFVKN